MKEANEHVMWRNGKKLWHRKEWLKRLKRDNAW
jgi:hypothetical protein